MDMTRDAMEHSIEHLGKELSKVRTGKASPSMISDMLVEYYGTPTPLSQVANIASADARTLTIQPWEKSMLRHIENAIFEANLGVTPQNDGEIVRLSFPPLNEERRREMVKKAKHIGEETKVGIRNHRREAMEEIKKAVKNGYPEDSGKAKEAIIQDMTNKYSEKVDALLVSKEKEIMSV
ncbi:MAG: ribosome recycling factor [Saprospiraceae bacterium]